MMGPDRPCRGFPREDRVPALPAARTKIEKRTCDTSAPEAPRTNLATRREAEVKMSSGSHELLPSRIGRTPLPRSAVIRNPFRQFATTNRSSFADRCGCDDDLSARGLLARARADSGTRRADREEFFREDSPRSRRCCANRPCDAQARVVRGKIRACGGAAPRWYKAPHRSPRTDSSRASGKHRPTHADDRQSGIVAAGPIEPALLVSPRRAVTIRPSNG